MNNKLSTIALLASVFMAFIAPKIQGNQTPDYSLARVEKMTGKYIFLNAEPLAEYDIAFTVKVVAWDNSQINGLSKIANLILNKALKISEKEGKEFDALIIKSGQSNDLAIKFKKP